MRKGTLKPRWTLPLAIGLAALIVAAGARIAADVIAFNLSRVAPAPAARPAGSPRPPSAAPGLSTFAPILEKGLFGLATIGPLTTITPLNPATAAAAAPPQAGNAATDLALLGTALGSKRETFAVIQRASTREEQSFRLGDRVFEVGTLVTVRKESAEVLSGGRRITLLPPAPRPAPAAAAGSIAPTGPPPPATTLSAGRASLATQVAAGSYVVDQRALADALDNIGKAMTDARMVPSLKEGKVEGFRVTGVRPQGIFDMVGIKSGDVLLRVNDFAIDSPEKAIQSFVALRGQSRVRLDLLRDGQPSTITYDIR